MEAWTLTTREEGLLQRWERKILKRIYEAVNESGVWRIRSEEFEQLYRELMILNEIKRGMLRWTGHLHRIFEERVLKKVFQRDCKEKDEEEEVAGQL